MSCKLLWENGFVESQSLRFDFVKFKQFVFKKRQWDRNFSYSRTLSYLNLNVINNGFRRRALTDLIITLQLLMKSMRYSINTISEFLPNIFKSITIN
jgi:hypothetical protein